MDRPGVALRAASALWGAIAARTVARPLEVPLGQRVIAVGSAVLGGAGKTPVATALARELSIAGARCALVSHAYRASPARAREVMTSDQPSIVGDDALASARELEGAGVPVIVAPTRSAALRYAKERGADVVVIDGLIQASPRRVSDAVLVLDERSPWGSRRCPPVGDLRAPIDALLAAVDRTVVVADEADLADAPSALAPRASIRLASSINGAVASDGSRHELGAIRLRIAGLLLGIAHPERVVRALARRGIEPRVVVSLADHASFRGALEELSASVDVWLTTARCATKLPAHHRGAPILALEHRVDVRPLVRALLARPRPG